MKTLTNPRRAMRPHPESDAMPAACAWCGEKIGRRVVFTRGTDMGQPAIVCPACVEPPGIFDRPAEIVQDNEFEPTPEPSKPTRRKKVAT